MGVRIGIIGLPNVGKSTFFNLVSKSSVSAENYPFCTIDPNVKLISIEDKILNRISKIVKTRKTTNAYIKFIDIAGLVRGANKGQGLGNEFLDQIRNTEALIHVVRDFENDQIVHIEGRINPRDDIKIIELELILKDLEIIERKIKEYEILVKQDKSNLKYLEYLNDIKHLLDEETLVYASLPSEDENLLNFREELKLLSDKKMIYLVNKSWEKQQNTKISDQRRQLSVRNDFPLILLDVKSEFELSVMDAEEKKVFGNEFGFEAKGMEYLIHESLKALDLITFYTAGEKETRAWLTKKGTKIQVAAGLIHSDFEKMFISAEVISSNRFLALDGWKQAWENGAVRLEGKGYIVQEGDIINIHHGAR